MSKESEKFIEKYTTKDQSDWLVKKKDIIAKFMESYHKEQLILFGVVKSDSELLHTEVFNLANKLAINGFGNEAVKMHQICNGM